MTAGDHSEPSDVTGADEAVGRDVVILDEEDAVVLEESPGSGADASAAGMDSRLAAQGADPDARPGIAGQRAGQHAGPSLAAGDVPAADPGSPGHGTGQDADLGVGPDTSQEADRSPGTGRHAEAPIADIVTDTGPELSDLGVRPETGPGLTNGDVPAAGPGPDDPGGPVVAEPAARTAQLQERWLAIQSDFVDDPHRSVAAAAELVTEAIDTLIAEIKERDASLRGTWDRDDADTEVLRNALRDYRSFLDRLVAR